LSSSTVSDERVGLATINGFATATTTQSETIGTEAKTVGVLTQVIADGVQFGDTIGGTAVSPSTITTTAITAERDFVPVGRISAANGSNAGSMVQDSDNDAVVQNRSSNNADVTNDGSEIQ
jgi:hypothetical protein